MTSKIEGISAETVESLLDEVREIARKGDFSTYHYGQKIRKVLLASGEVVLREKIDYERSAFAIPWESIRRAAENLMKVLKSENPNAIFWAQRDMKFLLNGGEVVLWKDVEEVFGHLKNAINHAAVDLPPESDERLGVGYSVIDVGIAEGFVNQALAKFITKQEAK